MPFVRVDDFDIYYEVTDFSDPWRRSDTIILHHGYCANTSLWYSWVSDLSKKCRVITMDPRGHGRSTVPSPGYKWSFNTMAKDITIVLDELNIDKAFYAGASMGGLIGQYLAINHSERLKGLILVCTTYRGTNPEASFKAWPEMLDKLGIEGMILASMETFFDKGKIDPNLERWFASQMGKTKIRVAKELIKTISVVDLTNQIQKISVPTLILAGERDVLCPLSEQKYMRDTIPNAELLVFEDIPHGIYFQVSEKCTGAILQFMEKVKLQNAKD